jgi:hypothetical protein
MMRIMARRMKATTVVALRSKSLIRRRLRLIPARVRSTTQRLGTITNLFSSLRLTISTIQLPVLAAVDVADLASGKEMGNLPLGHDPDVLADDGAALRGFRKCHVVGLRCQRSGAARNWAVVLRTRTPIPLRSIGRRTFCSSHCANWMGRRCCGFLRPYRNSY